MRLDTALALGKKNWRGDGTREKEEKGDKGEKKRGQQLRRRGDVDGSVGDISCVEGVTDRTIPPTF